MDRFGLQDAKDSKIPLDIEYQKMTETSQPMSNNDTYRKVIGALLYVATHTRPDIAASTSILSQMIEKPTARNWNEAKRVIRYLKGTKVSS
ncbi:integrase core domain protein [Lasius niger]|uniref:Integrase core domain protein n=1 Tax=Lasius niger TaxID=67767 RepID=A0A0J7MPY4_LASNI|nr:integrase core domain protein [Lasius niger]